MPSLQELEEQWITTQQAASIVQRSRQGAINLARDGRVRAVLVGRHEPVGRPVWIFDKRSCEDFAAKEKKRGIWWS